MPTFGRTGSRTWHLVGPDGCQYGRAFADDTKSPPDDTATASDIVAYEPPDSPDNTQSSPVSASPSLGRSAVPRGRTDDQRLVLPTALTESESALCESCRSQLERHQQRRSRVITGLKQVTPSRDIDWEVTERNTQQACDWCRGHESTTWSSDVLRSTVCPPCGRLFNTSLGNPEAQNTPDVDRLPDTPNEPVTPIVFGTPLPDYDPTELSGSNRPVIKYREKSKYATLIFELERTGHGFTADGITALDQVRASYADQVADDDAHQTGVTLDIGRTPRTVTLDGISPDDRLSLIGECWAIVSDPANWFPLGWPQQGWIHRRGADPAIPGEEPVVAAFPRLQTQQPAQSVKTERLRSMVEPGRYERGERYYERGAVTEIERVDDILQATVQGSRPYDVHVTLADGSFIEGQCSCPDEAVPCKHIVAAVLASGDVEASSDDRSLDEVLATASSEELRALLGSHADNDVTLRKRIYEELCQN